MKPVTRVSPSDFQGTLDTSFLWHTKYWVRWISSGEQLELRENFCKNKRFRRKMSRWTRRSRRDDRIVRRGGSVDFGSSTSSILSRRSRKPNWFAASLPFSFSAASIKVFISSIAFMESSWITWTRALRAVVRGFTGCTSFKEDRLNGPSVLRFLLVCAEKSRLVCRRGLFPGRKTTSELALATTRSSPPPPSSSKAMPCDNIPFGRKEATAVAVESESLGFDQVWSTTGLSRRGGK